MALQKQVNMSTGVTLPSAVTRVSWVLMNFEDKRVSIGLKTYKDAQAIADNLEPVSMRDIVMTAEEFQDVYGGTADPRKKLYQYIKTLPEFSDATDVTTP